MAAAHALCRPLRNGAPDTCCPGCPAWVTSPEGAPSCRLRRLGRSETQRAGPCRPGELGAAGRTLGSIF
eukprot:scaffold2842_cov373-Prasinococcus_capsulatus_cf.AAC.5